MKKTLSVTWYGMIRRCTNPSAAGYEQYGGRGITVCERWLHSLDNFISDMGERPKGHSLDRIDNNGNYEPSNCRWATQKQQQQNKRSNVVLTIEGKEYFLYQLVDQYGVRGQFIKARALRGCTFEQCVSKTRFYDTSSLSKAVQASVVKKQSQTHCKRGHPLSGENLYLKNNMRYCRICRRAIDRYLSNGKVKPIEYYLHNTK